MLIVPAYLGCVCVQLQASLAHIIQFLVLIWKGRQHQQPPFFASLEIARLRFELGMEAIEQQHDKRDAGSHRGCCRLLFSWADAG